MKVLLITPYFPPANAIGSVRASNLCQTLLSYGHEVRVVSAKHAELENSQSLPIHKKMVEYVTWFDSNPKHHLQNAKHGSESNLTNRLSNLRFLQKFVRSLWYWPDRYQFWLKPAEKISIDLIDCWRPDVIFASSPPFSSLILASRLSSKYGIPWVADFRDLWAGNEFNNVFFLRKLVDARWEKLVLRNVSHITTVSEDMSFHLRNRIKHKASVILNGFQEFNNRSWDKQSANDLNIVYTGSLYSGLRDLRPLLLAIKQLNDSSNGLRIKLKYYGADGKILERFALETKTNAFVTIKGTVPYPVSKDEQANADILLLAMWGNINEGGIYTGKFFEYLACCKPILVTGVNCGCLPDLVHDLGAGACGIQPDEIHDAIFKCVNILQTGIMETHSYKERLQEYTAQSQYTKLVGILEHLSRCE